MPAKFELRKNSGGQFSFSLKASNGEIILRSETYKTKKSRVIELIFSKPNSQLLGFADAFKLRKE